MDNTLTNLEDLQMDCYYEQKSKDERIKQLEQQNSELVAMLELSRKAYESLQSGDRENYNQSAKWMGKFLAGHKSVPLNNIKADAIEELLIDLLHISPSKPIHFIQKKLNRMKADNEARLREQSK